MCTADFTLVDQIVVILETKIILPDIKLTHVPLDRLYDNHNHIGKYSSEEVNKLRELHVKHGNNWQAIAAHLGRSAASVKDRCRLLNEHCNRGAWSTDEEDRLAAAVYDLAQVLPGEQVREPSCKSENTYYKHAHTHCLICIIT